MTGEKDAPAEMPGEIERILLTHTGLHFATELDRALLKDRLEALFAAITHEKEAAIKVAGMNATAGAFWAERGKSAEARALAAEAALAAERERCAKIAESVGNFGDYKREELTADYGQPRFDMMTAIAAAIRAEGE